MLLSIPHMLLNQRKEVRCQVPERRPRLSSSQVPVPANPLAIPSPTSSSRGSRYSHIQMVEGKHQQRSTGCRGCSQHLERGQAILRQRCGTIPLVSRQSFPTLAVLQEIEEYIQHVEDMCFDKYGDIPDQNEVEGLYAPLLDRVLRVKEKRMDFLRRTTIQSRTQFSFL